MTAQEANTLVALMEGRQVGLVTEDNQGRVTFTYDDQWQRHTRATPLSLSMPLAKGSHDDHVVRAFLWGLLPDNDQVLERWARNYQVSPQNPFALLCHVGEDCAGAVQFAMPGRVPGLLAGHGGVEWLTDDDVAQRLRALRRDPTAWHATSTGQFSLAGAQAKTALHYDAGSQRWGAIGGVLPMLSTSTPIVSSHASTIWPCAHRSSSRSQHLPNRCGPWVPIYLQSSSMQ